MFRKIMRAVIPALCAVFVVSAAVDVSAATMRKEVLSSTTSLPEVGEFNVIAEPFDWGKDVTRVMINPGGGNVSKADLNIDDFKVDAKHYSQQAYTDDYNGPRKIMDAYPVDAEGNKVESGQYIILDLEYGSNVQGAHTGSYNYANFYTPLTLTYTVSWHSENYKQNDVVSLLCDEFKLDRYVDNSIVNPEYNFCDYALYTPKEEKGKKPLVIFFHGMGEGGAGSLNNHGVQMYAYPEANFAGKEIQDIMGGNAYVLLPQSPNQWPTSGFTNESAYLDVVNSLIDSIIANNPDIDTNRIYVGGLSMGGYMASRVLLNRPDMYAAGFLCAQAYAITEEDAEKLKNLPMWISCCESDYTCSMDPYTFASYEKLVAAGNVDARCAVMEDNSQDPTSRFRYYDNSAENFTLYYPKQDNENKITGQFVWDNVSYSGHNGGWVAVFANGQFYENADGSKTTVMEWIASKNRYTGLEIDASKAQKTFTVGDTFNTNGLVVNVKGADGSTFAVTDYTVSGANMAAAGTYKVTVAYGGMTATYDVTVNAKAVATPPADLKPVSIVVELSESKVTLFKKGLNKIKLEGLYDETYSEVATTCDMKPIPLNEITWTSSNKKVATVNAKGVVTAKGAGTATITATYKGVSETCKITVKKGTFKIKKMTLNVKKGKTAKIKVTVSPKKTVKFKASSKIVKVNKKGVVKGVKKGTAKITVTYMGVKQTVTVKVK